MPHPSRFDLPGRDLAHTCGLAIAIAGLATLASCQRGEPTSMTEPEAGALLAGLRARPASPIGAGLAERFVPAPGGLRPGFPASERISARIVLPARSTERVHIEDAASGTAIGVTLRDARESAGQPSGGSLVYPRAHASGATLIHRPLPAGTEDFLSFETKPKRPEIAYDVALGSAVRGLRLVAGTLEILDAGGAPRLRVAPPFVVGADGARTDATIAVEGCAVDTNPAAPWGRPITAPGGGLCKVRVVWNDEYPAVLDPKWTTTGSMAIARQDHVMVVLPATGKVLVAGGRSSPTGTTGLATAELYDRTTGTWAATGGMTGGRWSASATLLNASSNGTTGSKVLVAGGINGTSSLSTAQLYSQTAGSWIAAGNLNAARHLHTATLLADGRVLVAGGMNGTATIQTAALYDPSSGAGSWTATIGPIPPAGLKNHTATLLVTSNQQLANHVLLIGGNNGSSSIASVYLFDPVQSAFSTLNSLSSGPREGHTATVLANGKILVTGGKNGSTTLATTILFDPGVSMGSWSSAGTMTAARQAHTATLLSTALVENGQVLVTGGSSGSSTLASTELWNGTSTWTASTAMNAPVQAHRVALLGGGTVLVAGGVNGSTTVSAAEVYDGSSGLSCTSASQCASGFCVGGVCCDTACNGGCGACNLTGKVGICSPITSGTVCRASVSVCDVAETCNGTSVTCPTDGFAPATTGCRAAAGECDLAENCTGSSASCPADAKKTSGTACTDDGNVCTKDQCDGTSTACQHPAGNPGTVCRPVNGECDVAETCTGTSTTCPTDGKKPSGTACTDDGIVCTTDTCNGSSSACQHPPGHAGTQCRSAAGVCDLPASCTGSSATCPANPFKPSSTVCRPVNGACDVAENCTGSAPSCPSDNKAPDGTACNDGSACTRTDTCQAGTCTGSNPVVCTASDQCHNAGTCDSSTGLCSNPTKPDGASCSDGNACTTADACQVGSCVGTAVTCTALDQCHLVGTCNTGNGVCSNPVAADGTSCGTDLQCVSGACQPTIPTGNPPTAINPTLPLDMKSATSFLYEGPNAQQVGVESGTIRRNQVGVCRGRVQDSNGSGIQNVRIDVMDHPEYGHTFSNADGVFSMAVNAGDDFRLLYQKAGYLSLQRVAHTRPLDYAWFPDVALTATDPARTVVDLSNQSSVQVAQATPTSDDSGTRQSILLFFPGTAATLVHGDGTTEPLTTLTVHSTEFTVGAHGPEAMPAALPPSSAYTYAVDLSARRGGRDRFPTNHIQPASRPLR
jgi:hypothetical protein